MKESCQLAPAEVREDVLPVGRRIELSRVRFELPREDRRCRSCPRGRARANLKDLRQVDDLDGLEGALLHADAAADAQRLGEEGHLVGALHLDAQIPDLHHRAGLLALLACTSSACTGQRSRWPRA